MSYATQQDMVDQFGEHEVIGLTDRDGLGYVDVVVLERAFVRATALIDSYLVGRYALPLARYFPLLTHAACDLARYFLSGAEVTEVEVVRVRYKDALRYLGDLRQGTSRLGADSGGQVAPEPARITVVGGSRIFTSDALAAFTD
jgi:phage gp36-like protein